MADESDEETGRRLVWRRNFRLTDWSKIEIGDWIQGIGDISSPWELGVIHNMARQLMAPNWVHDPWQVFHGSLKRTDESMFRSHCPACREGILLVRRNPETLVLLAEDNCIGCGKSFTYLDIDEMRASDCMPIGGPEAYSQLLSDSEPEPKPKED